MDSFLVWLVFSAPAPRAPDPLTPAFGPLAFSDSSSAKKNEIFRKRPKTPPQTALPTLQNTHVDACGSPASTTLTHAVQAPVPAARHGGTATRPAKPRKRTAPLVWCQTSNWYKCASHFSRVLGVMSERIGIRERKPSGASQPAGGCPQGEAGGRPRQTTTKSGKRAAF